jgi:hypothetical protein
MARLRFRVQSALPQPHARLSRARAKPGLPARRACRASPHHPRRVSMKMGNIASPLRYDEAYIAAPRCRLSLKLKWGARTKDRTRPHARE